MLLHSSNRALELKDLGDDCCIINSLFSRKLCNTAEHGVLSPALIPHPTPPHLRHWMLLSALHCKVQEKLPRVTAPLGKKTRRLFKCIFKSMHFVVGFMIWRLEEVVQALLQAVVK